MFAATKTDFQRQAGEPRKPFERRGGVEPKPG
jgi:hypothetical protein